ncbi:hypothetical protein [Desulfopila sp. IMCC35008]|uniref:hypothetical protein n=1 Tax=Desulfopila sp. IMCC35008 TaxID=2653858 RepID=UPI0013CF8EAF|nr:hypothetical protein [Desulfopila sp. IMCC35008]
MKSKEEFIQMLHAKIDEWDTEIDRLSAKAAMVEAESREDYYQQIAEMKAKRSQINEKLEKVRQSGENAWEDLKSGIDLALESMNEALRSAASRFK